MDSVKKVQKEYWKMFWEQPEIAAEIVSPTQRQFMPMFARMLETTKKERENSQWSFGNPITFADKPVTTPQR